MLSPAPAQAVFSGLHRVTERWTGQGREGKQRLSAHVTRISGCPCSTAQRILTVDRAAGTALPTLPCPPFHDPWAKG